MLSRPENQAASGTFCVVIQVTAREGSGAYIVSVSKAAQNDTNRKEARVANFKPGDLAVNVFPNGARRVCRVVKPWFAAHDGRQLGWVVRSPEAKRSGWAVESAALEPFAEGCR